MKKFFSALGILALLLSSVYFIFQLKIINILPSLYFLIACGIFLLLFLLLTILSIKSKGWLGKLFMLLLCFLISAAYLAGGYVLQTTNFTLNNVTTMHTNDDYYVSLIAKDDISLDSIQGKRIGKLENVDTYASEQMLQELDKKNITYETKDYASIEELVQALYNREVDAIIVNEVYRNVIQEIEGYQNFDKDTKTINTVQYEVEVEQNGNKVVDVIMEPFNVLITGTDSRYGVNATSRSDVNMVATINPKTGIVLLTSIPRDYYVPEVCSAAEGCPNGQMDKLTHTGNHGMNCVRKTIESFMGIQINYSIKVSFESVTQLVDVLGGIDVYSDASFDNAGNGNTKCKVVEGINHMNGECALGFARERYAYAQGDRHRIKNQQDVLVAIAKKALSPAMIVKYPKFMKALNGTFVTDMPMSDIQRLIQNQIQNNPSWSFEQYFLNGVGDWGFSAEMGQDLYMMYPDKETIKTGKQKIEAVLAGKSSKDIENVQNEKKNAVKEEWEGY